MSANSLLTNPDVTTLKRVILHSYSRCSLILTRPLGSYPKYQFHRGLGAFHPRGANRSTPIETQSSPNEESSSTTSNTTIKAILQWVATLSPVRDCTTKSINRPFILPKKAQSHAWLQRKAHDDGLERADKTSSNLAVHAEACRELASNFVFLSDFYSL